MTIKTTKVTGRRMLRFETMDDLQKEAERLAGGDVQMLGNWSLGQVLRHLSLAVKGSVDGFAFSLTWLEILYVRLFLKTGFLTHDIPSGYGYSRRWHSVMPGPTSTKDGLPLLREAVERFGKETKRSPHPAIGVLTPEEWYQFHLRHAELHLSFAVPRN